MLRLIGKRLVVIESPLAGDIAANQEYARRCLLDSLRRNEAPFASHLLYAHEGVLNDDDPDEREKGIISGLAWGDVADVRVVYTDRGISAGMQRAIKRSELMGQPIEYRSIGVRDAEPLTTAGAIKG